MKALIALTLLLTSSNVFACMGGRHELFNGKVVLTAESVRADFGMMDVNEDTIEMLENERNIGWYDAKAGGFVTLTVKHVKKDNGGIIDTYFEVKTEKGEVETSKVIKIESNYRGNGVRTRSIEVVPEADETYGC